HAIDEAETEDEADMVFVQHVEGDVDTALQLGEPLHQPVPVSAPDPEIELVAREAAQPGGGDQPVLVQQVLARGGAREDDESFTFQKSPDKGDDVEPVPVVFDQAVDIDVPEQVQFTMRSDQAGER